VFLAEQFSTSVMLLYWPLLPGGLTPWCMHLVTVMLWAALPISAALRYFTRELGDKLNLLMIIYSGLIILECHLVITILGDLLFIFLVAGAKKRKEERKERRHLVFFLEFVTCNLSFLLL
jgi:hypothetical protein